MLEWILRVFSVSVHHCSHQCICKRQPLRSCLPPISCGGVVSELGVGCCCVDRKKLAWYCDLYAPHSMFWKACHKCILQDNTGNTLQESGAHKVLNKTPIVQELPQVSTDELKKYRTYSKGKKISRVNRHPIQNGRKSDQLRLRKGSIIQIYNGTGSYGFNPNSWKAEASLFLWDWGIGVQSRCAMKSQAT